MTVTSTLSVDVVWLQVCIPSGLGFLVVIEKPNFKLNRGSFTITFKPEFTFTRLGVNSNLNPGPYPSPLQLLARHGSTSKSDSDPRAPAGGAVRTVSVDDSDPRAGPAWCL